MKEMFWCVCVCVYVSKRERAKGSCRPTGCWTESVDFSFAKKQKQPDLMRQLCPAFSVTHTNTSECSVSI